MCKLLRLRTAAQLAPQSVGLRSLERWTPQVPGGVPLRVLGRGGRRLGGPSPRGVGGDLPGRGAGGPGPGVETLVVLQHRVPSAQRVGNEEKVGHGG